VGEERTQSFSHFLRQYRLAAGLTQEALAERAGVSTRSIQALERGDSRPHKDTAHLLAAGLGLKEQERTGFLAAATPAPRHRAARSDATSDHTRQPAPYNLPAALAPLIGRDQEQARVRELLGEARLVTLIGSGGVGKTRLALAVAEQLTSSYAEGVWLIELAPLTDPALVPGALARTLGLREDPERSPMQLLVDSLRGKRALLMLDNCEHLVAACAALVTTLLQACPALHILATSQEPLGVVGERRYRVPSLAVPDARPQHGHELLGRYEAVQLFIVRAREHREDFALSAANARAVAEICARLDGIPLAIELAAARVDSLPVETIAARLDDRFTLLTMGARTALPRHQTLRATLDWSYDLLSRPEQMLLQRLAAFAGGASLEAAEAVCADQGSGVGAGQEETCQAIAAHHRDSTGYPIRHGDEVHTATELCDAGAASGAARLGDQSVLDLLHALAQRSLAQAEQGRYTLLETIRVYAHERLTAQGQETATRWRHARYYLRFAEHAAATLTGSEQGLGLARLAVEHDNLRGALRWARERGDGPLVLQLTAALWRFWYLRGYLSEGRAWLEAALALGGEERVATRATACHGAGVLAWAQGDHARAAERAEQALALWRTLGDRAGSARALNLLGLIAIDQEDWDRAAQALGESLALRRDLQDQWGTATSLHNLGTVARGRGDHARATALYAESLALRVALADEAGMAISYRDQAALALAQGEESRAQSLYRQSMPLASALGDLVGVAQSLEGLAAIAARQARPEPATRLLSAAAALREQVGAPVTLRERAAHEHLVSSVRAALGAAFEHAQSAGREVPWADLVASIFGGADR
jgi:predicted ATPase/DNA-binding XRE family transcriptional regulator